MKIAVFRALYLADMLCLIPALRALRSTYPQAEITLISLPWTEFVVDRYTYVDRLIVFSGFPGLPETPYTPANVVDFIVQMQKEKFDLILQMQGNGSIVNPLIELYSAKKTAGFYRSQDYVPTFTNIVEYPNYGSEIHRLLALIIGMKIPLQGDYLEFPLFDSDYEEVEDFMSGDKPYICIHPGARDKKRRCSSTVFAEIASFCIKKGFRVFLTGTQEEWALCERIQKKMRYSCMNIAGKTTLGGLGALIHKSTFLISNDTGVVHIAAALKKPSVILSINSDRERWEPLNTTIHHTLELKKSSSAKEIIKELEDALPFYTISHYHGSSITSHQNNLHKN